MMSFDLSSNILILVNLYETTCAVNIPMAPGGISQRCPLTVKGVMYRRGDRLINNDDDTTLCKLSGYET